ncbi:nicotinate phosphoribosyltransferase [Candidatus Pacearchaeota archaeon]|nr:nicotinate phosphoribosyltransferase [Candidatus Pacearchaeota archaeon]
MIFDPTASTDFYKIGHIRQYPEGTEEVYSNMTARSNTHANAVIPFDYVVNFGLQYAVKHLLIRQWNENFFKQPLDQVIYRYKRRITNTLGPDYADANHFEALHKLGYLPIKIKALPEGAKVPIGVPLFTIVNTLPDFFWLTNFLETSLSSYLWKPITSATTAYQYRLLFEQYAERTGAPMEFIDFQGHDFSFRGLSNPQDAMASGMGHLLSFKGTDTIPAIDGIEYFYNGNIEEEMVGVSVPATEHSVMCMGGEDDEIATFERLINVVYPKGIVSIVSDTWDFWQVVTQYLPKLKQQIMVREGKVVIRPDSGDPVKIIVGDPDAKPGTPQFKGAIECLWETFGGVVNEQGYKMLNEHIGLIYGDSISLDRANRILHGLEQKGFASSNIVLGIGSYTYQYVTRDTHGFAIKSTAGKVNGVLREISKDPKTDDGTKKSAKGLLRVELEDGKYVLYDQQTEEQEKRGELKIVFKEGKFIIDHKISDIRKRLQS